MKRNQFFLFGSRDIFSPLLIYYVVIMVAMYAAGFFVGTGDEWYNLRKIIGAIITIPFLYLLYFKPDRELFPEKKIKVLSLQTLKYAVITIFVATIMGIGVNNLTVLVFPVDKSEGFAQANQVLFGSALVFQILNSVVITPFLEEMLYRGIIFGRLQRMLSGWLAVVLSGVIFGFMHFNMVQFIYASAIGMVLALLVRMSGHFWTAVLGHMSANLIAIFRNRFDFLGGTLAHAWWSYLLAVGLIAVGGVLLLLFYKSEVTKDGM